MNLKFCKPAEHNDYQAVGEEGDEDEDRHEVAIDDLNNIQWTQPRGGIH